MYKSIISLLSLLLFLSFARAHDEPGPYYRTYTTQWTNMYTKTGLNTYTGIPVQIRPSMDCDIWPELCGWWWTETFVSFPERNTECINGWDPPVSTQWWRSSILPYEYPNVTQWRQYDDYHNLFLSMTVRMLIPFSGIFRFRAQMSAFQAPRIEWNKFVYITWNMTNNNPTGQAYNASLQWTDTKQFTFEIQQYIFDGDGDPIRWVLGYTSPSGCGNFTINNTTIVYTSGFLFAGTCTLFYGVTDEAHQTDVPIVITVNDHAPVLPGRFYSMHWTVLQTGFTVTNMMQGAFDADGDAFWLNYCPTTTADGQASVTYNVLAHSAIVQTPPGTTLANVNTTFTYTVTDGPLNTPVIVTIFVQDNPPVIANRFYSMHWTVLNAGYLIPNLMLNATDGDADPIWINYVPTVTPDGVANIQYNAVTRDVTITSLPATTFVNANTSFTYTVTDGPISTPSVITIYVQDIAPVVTTRFYSLHWNVVNNGFVVPNLLSSAFDADGDRIWINSMDTTTPNATARIMLNSTTNDVFVQTLPGTTFINANTTFVYSVTDGPMNTTCSVTIFIQDVIPVALPRFYSLHWSVIHAGFKIPNILSSTSDGDGDKLWINTIDTQTTNGVASVVFDTNTTDAMIQTPIGTTFINGNVSFSYTVTDGPANATSTITLYIFNSIPVATDDLFTVNGSMGGTFFLNVLSNDYDLDQPTYDLLKIFNFSSTLVGTLNFQNGGFYYTPPNDTWIGTDSFMYSITDGISISNTVTATILVKNAGAQYFMGFGANSNGQLGHGDKRPRNFVDFVSYWGDKNMILKQVCSGTTLSVFLTLDGHVFTSVAGSSTPAKLVSVTTMIACGSNHYMLGEGAHIWTWGSGANGRLGHGNTTDYNFPHEIAGLQGVTLMAAGAQHSMVLSNGKVLAFGYGAAFGMSDQLSPVVIPIPTAPKEKIIYLSLGDSNSMFLTSLGRVFVMGNNAFGQLGIGNTSPSSVAILLPFSEQITQISTGRFHSMMISVKGTLYGFGNNARGELGLGDTNIRTAPVKVGSWDFTTLVSCGEFHTFVVVNGTTYGFGANDQGQLGLGYTSTVVTSPAYVYGPQVQTATATYGSTSFLRTCTVPGYTCLDCLQPICNGITANNYSVCSGNGVCSSPNTCTCNPGWGGNQCSTILCFDKNSNDSNACSGNGTCAGPNNCLCVPGFGGSQCETFLTCNGKNATDPTVCNVRGHCTSVNLCSCTAGYGGVDCELNVCFGLLETDGIVCSQHGICQGPGTCSCTLPSLFVGPQCGDPICYGIVSTDKTVCGAHGSCLSPDSCVCNQGYSDSQCGSYSCFGVSSLDPTVCSMNGTCVTPDGCRCAAGYSGRDCSIPSCGGIGANMLTVCSGYGNCTSFNNCTCMEGHDGPICEYGGNSGGSNPLYLLFLLALIPVGLLVVAGIGVGMAVVAKLATTPATPYHDVKHPHLTTDQSFTI